MSFNKEKQQAKNYGSKKKKKNQTLAFGYHLSKISSAFGHLILIIKKSQLKVSAKKTIIYSFCQRIPSGTQDKFGGKKIGIGEINHWSLLLIDSKTPLGDAGGG